jgi:hypothetical protein
VIRTARPTLGLRGAAQYGIAFIVGAMFVCWFTIGRFSWAPTILREHPFIPAGCATALVVGGALGWALRSSRVEDCRSETAALNALRAAGELTWQKQGVPNLERLGERAARASLACDRVGLDAEASEARTVLEQIGPEVMSGKENDRQIERDQSVSTSTRTTSTDPASCPRGRMLIDANTGKAIPCTGPATATTATSPTAGDDEDIRSRIRALGSWDGVTIVKWRSDPPHLDVEVVVAESSWDFLGEHDRHEAFTRAALESFKGHWTQFHRWSGDDPAGHQVHVYTGGWSGEKLVATMSATGFYLE